MNILITGSCGFIGFNLAEKLLKVKQNKVCGIDNINNYYSVKLKKERLKVLCKNKNFKFYKTDICKFEKLSKIIKKFKPEIIYNFAAQAGVQYSMKYPKKYLENNINGFFNILEISKQLKIKKIIYASSSSVYGDQKKSPLKENLLLAPKNFYGMSKKNNEEMAQIYSELYGIKTIGLRFFSVFGEWGRPDMIIFKLLKAIKDNKKFYLNNYGNHYRDFTYIKDVIEALDKLRKINFSNKKSFIFNICSNKSVKVSSMIDFISAQVSSKPNIVLRKFQLGDIYKTHGSNNNLKKHIKIKFTEFYPALLKTINWNKKYLKLK